MTAKRSSKRLRRTSSRTSTTVSGPLPFVQHERANIWFQDGSVILVTATHLFKVYRGILAQHSSVFQTIFSLPQPDPEDMRPGELLEGVPVIELDDDWKDLQNFLALCFRRK